MRLSIDTSGGKVQTFFDDKYRSHDEIKSVLAELNSINKKLLKIYKNNSDIIDDIENYNPIPLSTKTLMSDHRLSHSWADILFSGADFKYSLSQVKSLHDRISNEMMSRGLIHRTPLELPKNALNQLIAHRRHMDKPIDSALFNAFDEFMLTQKKKRFSYHRGNLRFEDPKKNHLNVWSVNNSSDNRMLVLPKGFQPLSFLSAEARVFSPAREILVDKGLYELGADKPFFKEYFIEGKILKGRHVMRKMPLTGDFRDAGKSPFSWFFWKPKDQTPYILSSSLRKQDFPIGESSASWLPSALESKIPIDSRWWGKDITREEAVSLIKSSLKFFNDALPEFNPPPGNGIYDLPISDSKIEQIIDLSDPQLQLSRSQIAEIVGCGGSTVYSWQRKCDLL